MGYSSYPNNEYFFMFQILTMDLQTLMQSVSILAISTVWQITLKIAQNVGVASNLTILGRRFRMKCVNVIQVLCVMFVHHRCVLLVMCTENA